MILILCQVLLYIQADEVKNRKKQRKVETEVLPQDTVGKQQYKLNKKDNTILFSNKKIDICKGGRPSPEACHCSKQEHCSLKQRDQTLKVCCDHGDANDIMMVNGDCNCSFGDGNDGYNFNGMLAGKSHFHSLWTVSMSQTPSTPPHI